MNMLREHADWIEQQIIGELPTWLRVGLKYERENVNTREALLKAAAFILREHGMEVLVTPVDDNKISYAIQKAGTIISEKTFVV